MKKVLLALSVLVSSVAAAQEHHDHGRHDEETPFDVESFQLTLQGSQAFGETCYLGVNDQGLDKDGLYFAEIETSFSHDGVGAGVLRVVQDKANSKLLTALKEDGSRIAIQLSVSGGSVRDTLKYAVRWAHEGHTDTGLCSDLSVIHDQALEAAEQAGTSPVQALVKN